MGYSRKKNLYFTKVHEQAIIDYCSTKDMKTRNELYNIYIGPAFDEMVDKIVYQLKRAMLPSYVKGGFGGITDEDRTLKIPNTMDIEYFYAPPNSNSTQRNNYLNKIATCYLTDMSVSYGGDRYKAYRPS